MAVKISQFFPASLLAASFIVLAGQAQAAQIHATDVVYYDNNNSVNATRSDTANALGADSYNNGGYFLSLGLGGRAVFDFGQEFSGEISLWEATGKSAPETHTYAKQESYDERVDIYYGNFESVTEWQSAAADLSQWSYAGDIFNIADTAYFADGATNAGEAAEGVFNYVMLVDKSEAINGRDGFDVRAIAVTPTESDPEAVPEPTSTLSLLMLGSVGITRVLKRKTLA